MTRYTSASGTLPETFTELRFKSVITLGVIAVTTILGATVSRVTNTEIEAVFPARSVATTSNVFAPSVRGIRTAKLPSARTATPRPARVRLLTASPTVPLITVLSLFVREGSLDRTFRRVGRVVSRVSIRVTVAELPAASRATIVIVFGPSASVIGAENTPVTESTATPAPFTVTFTALGAMPLTVKAAVLVTPSPEGFARVITGGIVSTVHDQVVRARFPAMSWTSSTAEWGPSENLVGVSYATVSRL